MRVSMATLWSPGTQFGVRPSAPEQPRHWCNTPIVVPGAFPNLDLAPDGKHFVVFATGEAGDDRKISLHLTFLVNFFDELRRRMPAGRQ